MVDTGNVEERALTLVRILDMLVTFYELHNFPGMLEVTNALTLHAVSRLEHAFTLAMKVHILFFS